MFTRKYILFSSMLVAITTHAAETSNSSMLYEGVQIAASDNALGILKEKAIGKAENFVESESKNFISPYLNYAEIAVNVGSGSSDSTFEIIGLKAYDNNGLQNGFLFNQFGLNYFDERTTVNLGLGYRYLTEDKNWLLGANVFYDYEVEDQHQRSGAGIEIKSSIFKVTYNIYNGISDYKNDRSGTDSKALDGSDLKFDLTMPYLPGLAMNYTKFKWDGDAGADDLKGKDISLKGKLSTSFYIDAGRTFYDGTGNKDYNWIKLTYQINLGKSKSEASIFDLSKHAYQLSSIEHEKYKPVQRVNRIVKQKQFATTVSGN